MNSEDERKYWYLNYADVPDDEEDETSEAYSEAPARPLETQEIIGQAVARQAFGDAGCKSCNQPTQEFVDSQKIRWNSQLGLEEVRLCSQCGQTSLTTRVKDQPNKYICKECFG